MKTKCHIITAAVIALNVFIQTVHAASGLPAPKPEFLSPEQLANWNRGQGAAKAQKIIGVENHHPIKTVPFYTGKPFDSDSVSYLFKYRNFSPETSAWTTDDPTGFPDGANMRRYAPTPLSDLDPTGAFSLKGSTSSAAPYTNANWIATGITATKESMSASNTFGISTWTVPGSSSLPFNISYSGSELGGSVDIRHNVPGGSSNGGKLTMQMYYSGDTPSGTSFVWMQVAYKIFPDHTDPRVPDTATNYPYISGANVMDDVPKLIWVDGADFVAYTFLATKSGNNIVIYDSAIKWGFGVDSLE